jgi:membrane protease YdiL (CAAX protease family)
MNRTRAIAIYAVVAFGFSWFVGAILFMRGPRASVVERTVLMLIYMWGPLLGALAAQRAAGEPLFAPLGVGLKANRWWIAAWLLPFALQPLIIAGELLFHGVSFSPDLGGFFDRLTATLPPDRVAEARKKLDGIPHVVFWALQLGQALIAGITINAFAAFGEELGWRGFMFRHFEATGFWRRSSIIGFVWGVWHAPLILQGHNYPQHPRAGVLGMIAFCMLMAPMLDLVRLRGRSVWAACIMHGTINATAGLAIVLVRGGDDLVVGMSGAAGLTVLAMANGLLFAADRYRGGALTADRPGGAGRAAAASLDP